MEPYYETKLGKLYHGNCLDIIPNLAPVDLILTSPPYDNIRIYKGFEFDFKKTGLAIFKILKDNGVCVWIVGDQTKRENDKKMKGIDFDDKKFIMRIFRHLDYLKKQHDRGYKGSTWCPLCKRKNHLLFMIADHKNKHIYASCKDKECLNIWVAFRLLFMVSAKVKRNGTTPEGIPSFILICKCKPKKDNNNGKAEK